MVQSETQTHGYGHCKQFWSLKKTLDDDVIDYRRLENVKCLVAGRAKELSRGTGTSIIIPNSKPVTVASQGR